MKTIRENLNKLDLKGIDNNDYYDLRNLYEAVEHRMTPQDKQELKKLLDVTDDPETISAYLSSKDESLNESEESVENYSSKYDNLINDLWTYFENNNFYPEDIYGTEDGFVVDIDGDWKHEHIKGDILIHRYLEDNNISGIINTVPVEDESEEESDNYFGHHVVKIQALDENLQFKNLKESINEDYSSNVETITKELYTLISDAMVKASELIEALRKVNDRMNAKFVYSDVSLLLEDDNLHTTLQDILDKYSKGN